MRPVVGVMGGGDADPATHALAEALGEAIARRGWILLNGGRNAGVMAASARGARRAGGFVVGVLPGRREDGGEAADLDLRIYTDLGDARNAVNALSSDVVVVLPGGVGTLSEAALGVKAGRPVVLVAAAADWREALGRGRDVHVAASVQEALAAVDAALGQGGRVMPSA